MRFARNKFRSSISVRIAALFCITFAAGLGIAFVITYFQIRHTLEAAGREVISAKLREASTVLGTDGIAGLRKFLSNSRVREQNSQFMVRVLSSDGTIVFLKPSVQAENFNFNDAAALKVNPIESLGWSSIPAIDDEDTFDLLTERVGESYFLQVGRSSENREDLLERLVSTFLWLGAILIAFSGVLGIWYARQSLAPLRDFASTMQKIERGDFSQRMSRTESDDELRNVGEIFNRMIVRIEMLIGMMKESLDNVAHDIRTPLARIRIVAEDALLDNENGNLREALIDCSESSQRISELVDQLFSISEAEAGLMKLKVEVCNIQSLFLEVIDVYEFVAAEKGIQVLIDVRPTNLSWRIDRKRVKQAIANLLDNSIKFSDQGSNILLSGEVNEQQLILSVQDDGTGIDQSDLPRIWDRLYRGDKSRSTKGLGLGLSIVKSIVVAHGGSVEVEKTPSSPGTTISLSFPVVI